MAAIVPAAGRGTRLGAGGPKAFVEVGGRSMIERAVLGLLKSGVVDDVVAVVPYELRARAEGILFGIGDRHHTVAVATGGAERTDSVRNGLAVLAGARSSSGSPDLDEFDAILVHDAARCLTPADVITRVVGEIRSGARAVIPVLPVADTIKSVDDAGIVTGTPDRASLRIVQTPQGFDPATLQAAYDAATDHATDDAGLVECLEVPVETVDGDPRSFKITTREDLERADALVRQDRSRWEL